MITLKLTQFSHQNGIYIVTLGNGTRHELKSEKDCLKFLVNTSNFLTERYNELNLLFGDIFYLYRQNYFYLDNNRHQPHAKLFETRRNINCQVGTIENFFERISFTPQRSEANLIIFKELYFLIDYLIDICLQIKQLNEKKSYASTLIRADFLIKQLQEEKNQIQNFSLKTATSFDPNLLYSINFEAAAHLKIV